MELKFKRLNSRAELPRKAHATDAGLDLTVTSFSMDHKANTIQYGFGLAVEIPAGHVGLLFPRSSVYKTGLSLTTYTLCDEELTTDVVVTVTGDDNALISQFTVSDVSVKKNRITTLTGDVFGRGNGFSVAIDDSWDEGLDVNF